MAAGALKNSLADVTVRLPGLPARLRSKQKPVGRVQFPAARRGGRCLSRNGGTAKSAAKRTRASVPKRSNLLQALGAGIRS